MSKVAALYVQTDGIYYGLPDVDPWDEKRDARIYNGPYPVVAHPPCARWGKYWSGGPSAKVKRKLGDDANCFASALHCVKLWGGVLEHPAYSKAWQWFGLTKPHRDGGWYPGILHEGWVCHVEQGHYGHKAQKATWLFVKGAKPFELKWGPSKSSARLDKGYHSSAERVSGHLALIPRITARECAATSSEFRDLLIRIANV
ncbi:hypothetical protein LCGC14_2753990 [marine sediment metagenome]|uniref:Uncharacterized protein n=1 Tax=marine sediment metagenome TaxID=412755 RepID=A0A0F9BSN2_9ZZZZ